jgi:hypothetical protein
VRKSILVLVGAVALAVPPSTATAVGYSDEVLSSGGLVSYWRLDETAGTTAADAKAANPGSYAGTYSLGATGLYASDALNRAVDFDGASGRVAVPDAPSLDLTSGLSLEAWIRPDALSGGDGLYTVIRKESAYMLRVEGTTLVFRLTIGGSSQELRVSNALTSATTYHVAATYDGATMKLYRDGVEIGSRSQTGAIGASSSALSIASYPGGGSHFNGKVDEVALYSSALTGGAVSRHHARGTCTPAFGTFAAELWPAGCWQPYSTSSPFNKPIPGSPDVAADSADVVDKLTGWGPPTALRPGVAGSSSASDYDHPTYYSESTDPLFTIAERNDGYDSDYWNTQIRIPQQALPADGSDAHMTVIDQATGTEWDLWEVASTAGGADLTALPNGGGTIYASGFGKADLHGSGLAIGEGDANAGRWGLVGGIVRHEELAAARVGLNGANAIPHALFMVVKSTDGSYVYPASGAAGASDPIDAPPDGAHFQLDMTENEIDALTTPWYNKAILKAMAKYGMFVGDTSGSHPWTIQIESGFTYTSFGEPDPWRAFGDEHDGDGWMDYSAGSDLYYWDIDAVDWESELRMLDPCVSAGTC